jgi:hypothetical protein
MMEQTLIMLRDDAQARGLHELALVYGWSLLRLKGERIVARLELKLLDKPNG